ncbi:MAG TPA: methyltransferase domain-containing protein [Elusimicrobiota bacterium]|nr:methyltransferase domain-containing protein [Elusimicrobiota bacterium]
MNETALKKWSRFHAPMGCSVGGVDGRVEALLRGRVLNIGAKAWGRPEWIPLDLVSNDPRTALLADAADLPVRSGVLDGAVLRFVLEHVPSAERVVAETHRALRPGGLLFVTVPFVEPYHADPQDFRRFTPEGLKKLLENFEMLECGTYYGPASALVEFLREFTASFFDSVFLKKGVRFLAGWTFFPLKYLDVFLGRKKFSWMCAYSLYAVAQKR